MRNKINSNFIIKQIKNKKGFALLGTLILVFVVSTFGIALLTMTQNDIKLSTLQKASKETFYIAESGIEHAISYLEILGTPDFPSPHYLKEEEPNYIDLGNGKYKASIQSAGTFSYLIRSEGQRPWSTTSGYINKTIECKVILENFALYAYFSDNELFPDHIDPSYHNQKIWFYGDDHIGGPVHSNDRLHMAGTPTFEGPVTSAWEQDGDVSWEAYDSQTSPNFLGIPPYEGGIERIELPNFRVITDSNDPKSLQRIAAGSKEFIDTNPNGVYVPHDASNNVTNGIWVKGNIKNLVLGTDSQGNSQIIVDRTDSDNKKTIITTVKTPVSIGGVIRPSGTTVIDVQQGVDHTYSPLNGFNNGVLFVNGEVKSLQSTAGDGGVKGKLTIASNNTITIGNNILYKTKVDNHSCFDELDEYGYPDIPDSLGLISEAGDIKIASDAPSNLEINAILMALGTSFYYEGWKNKLKDILTVHGGFIQTQRGPVGTFNSWGKQSGYTKNYEFDTRMSIDNPHLGQALPPYFPTTGKYIKLYWKEVD